LSIQRIPYSSKSPAQKGKPVVFLQHGVLDSANTWVNNYKDESLAFILADAGFDVWLGNIRGNLYSARNTHIPVSSPEFWQFSWDQHASIDVPTMLNYALETSGQAQVAAYIGHSQGGTCGFVLFSTNAEMARKVKLFVALAPVTYMAHVTNKFFKAMAAIHLDTIFQLLGVKEFLPSTKFMEFILPHACDGAPAYCKNIYCMALGCDFNAVNTSRLPVYFSHLPAGSSVMNMAHWAQAVRTGQFQYYDFGSAKKNEEHYGQPKPPQYDIANIKVKTAVFYAGKDTLADTADVKAWLPKVPKDLLVLSKEYPGIGHCDMTWGTQEPVLGMYREIVQLINKNN